LLIQTIKEETSEGRQRKGRQQKFYVNNIKDWNRKGEATV